MSVTGIVTGAVIGSLARLVLPGRQRIPVRLTVLVGIVAALLGTALAGALGLPTATSGIDWWELLVQLVLAVIGGRCRGRGVRPPQRPPPTRSFLTRREQP